MSALIEKIEWMRESLAFARSCAWRGDVHVDGDGVVIRVVGVDRLSVLQFDTDFPRVKSTSYNNDKIRFRYTCEGWCLEIVLERGSVDTREDWQHAIRELGITSFECAA